MLFYKETLLTTNITPVATIFLRYIWSPQASFQVIKGSQAPKKVINGNNQSPLSIHHKEICNRYSDFGTHINLESFNFV